MKLHYYLSVNSLLLSIILLTIGCTENPFSNDKISVPDRTIRGKVELSDHSSPEGVFVWLDGFDFGVLTDKKGSFQFNLPPPQAQGGRGLTGNFKIYYYMANYKLATSNIVLRNGEIDFLHGDINKNGELKEPKYLVKTLNIKTEINPSLVNVQYNGFIQVDLTLQATYDTVIIQYPNKSNGPLAILMTQKTYPQDDFFEILEVNSFASNAELIPDTITVAPKEWTAFFVLNAGDLSKGKYKIIPYFLIEQIIVPPSELLNNLGQDLHEPKRDYLNIPIKREGGDFEVEEITR